VVAFPSPGSYAITSDQERLSNVLERAGGVRPNAYDGSFRLVRNGRPVAVDLVKVRRKVKTDDILLADGDQLMIEGNTDVVNVGGAVERPVSVPYRAVWELDDYINAAGGFSPKANTKSIIVTYASGAVKRKRNGWFGTGGSPSIKPGATVTVGTHDAADEHDWSKVIATTAQVTVTMMSLIIAYVAVKK
jgi:polysaccharide biosynthesis/export protein